MMMKRILESLMDMVNQNFYHPGNVRYNGRDVIQHNHVAAHEETIDLLIELGLAEEFLPRKYILLWDKLDEEDFIANIAGSLWFSS